MSTVEVIIGVIEETHDTWDCKILTRKKLMLLLHLRGRNTLSTHEKEDGTLGSLKTNCPSNGLFGSDVWLISETYVVI